MAAEAVEVAAAEVGGGGGGGAVEVAAVGGGGGRRWRRRRVEEAAEVEEAVEVAEVEVAAVEVAAAEVAVAEVAVAEEVAEVAVRTGSGCNIESGRINAESLPPQPLRTASNKTTMKHIAPAWIFMGITKEIRRNLVSKNLPGQWDDPVRPA